MKTRRLLPLPLLTVAVLVLTSAASFCESHEYFGETGTLTEMQAVPCGSQARGFTGIGGLFATAGLEHRNSKDKLCQEYSLRTSYIEYRIRPVNDKDPVLLPVGEKSQFRIAKDHILLSVLEGEGKVRECKVVGMKPLAAPDDSATEAKQEPGQLQHRPAGDGSKPVQGASTDADPPRADLIDSDQSVPRSTVIYPADHRSSLTALAVLPVSSPAASATPEAAPNVTSHKPLTPTQLMGLVAGGVPSKRVSALVAERGIDFQPIPEFLTGLKSAGASDGLLNALRAARSSPRAQSKAHAPGVTASAPDLSAPPGEVRRLQQADQQ